MTVLRKPEWPALAGDQPTAHRDWSRHGDDGSSIGGGKAAAIVSETTQIRAFLTEADASSLYLSVLTVGALRKGVAIKGESDSDVAALLTG